MESVLSFGDIMFFRSLAEKQLQVKNISPWVFVCVCVFCVLTHVHPQEEGERLVQWEERTGKKAHPGTGGGHGSGLWSWVRYGLGATNAFQGNGSEV